MKKDEIMPGYKAILDKQERRDKLEGLHFEIEEQDGDILVRLMNKENVTIFCEVLLVEWFFPRTRINLTKKALINKYLKSLQPTKDFYKQMSGPANELIKHPYKGEEDE